MRGVAFKVTYNDGGAVSGGLVGYRGVCSNRAMLENIRENHMTNCSDQQNPCRLFIDSNFLGKRPSIARRRSWCYESTLLATRPWRFGAGMYHNGLRTGEAIPMTGVEPGDIAFLTTIAPGGGQSVRFIFAMFRIGTLTTDDWGGNYVISDGSMEIQIPDPIAQSVRFWDYFANKDVSEMWGAGLHRYISPDNTTRLLGEVMGLLGDSQERDVIFAAVGGQIAPRPRRRLPLATPPNRPYGFGGESEAHRRLKEYVAENPAVVGLPSKSRAEIEFGFHSGDAVDVKFDLPDGSHAVVEIETIVPFPGAHQCIKYRALLEAHKGYPLNSGYVRAILVAHEFDTRTRLFAAKYGIKLFKIKI